jgi:hypothetical protein
MVEVRKVLMQGELSITCDVYEKVRASRMFQKARAYGHHAPALTGNLWNFNDP